MKHILPFEIETTAIAFTGIWTTWEEK